MGTAETVSRLNLCLAFAAIVLAGCTSGAGLLEPTSNSGTFNANPLALPPQDTLAIATPGANQDDDTLESDGAPSLTDLNSFTQPGIDPAKESKELESKIQSAAIDPGVKWRGRISDDGIDLANINGVLCSSPTPVSPKSHTVNMACSDGRMATLRLNEAETGGILTLGGAGEKAVLEKN